METLNILFIGAGTGAILAIISMLIINTANSERYPVGGFLPTLWMVLDLGESSKLAAAGILMMGGITGFYLMLSLRKLKFDTLKNKLKIQTEHNQISKENITVEQETVTVSGKSLAEFLK
ncbi:MAG: hypothetical protein MAG581_02256 [Deltaproteobacteria bacterium]|jgi:hypothetical protein|nr:hypothetical protein [Deltaproteobacteria bacterium]